MPMYARGPRTGKGPRAAFPAAEWALSSAARAAAVEVAHRSGGSRGVGALRYVPTLWSLRHAAPTLRARFSPEWLVALLAFILSVAAYAFYAARGLTLAYNDAISHLLIARRVLDGRTPGLAQFGTTWLPFNHALMLPFVWSDILFRSGFAGAFPSMIAFVIGTVYLYRLGVLAFTSSAAGWIAAATFAFNPSTLYMQSTPMSELDLMALAVVAIFYTTRWAQTFQPADLVKAAAAALGGTLVRYDGWALALALAAIVLYLAWRKGGRPFAESNVLLFGTLAFIGCIGWLLYNQVIFGDALAFLGGRYSSQAMQMRLAADGGLPTLHNPLLSLHVYAQATVDTGSLPLVLAALAGLCLWMLRQRLTFRFVPLYALLVPFAFNCLSLVVGNSALDTPEIPVHGVATYYNERYGLMMIPAMALFFAYLAHRRRVLVTAGLVLPLMFGIVGSILSVPYALEDALVGVAHSQLDTSTGTWLHDHYHGGNILISYAALAPTIFYAQEPDDVFITDSNGTQFDDALRAPNQWAALIVMRADDPSDLVAVTLGKRQGWRQYYVLSQTFGPVQIYQRIDTPSVPPAGAPGPTAIPVLQPPNRHPSPDIDAAAHTHRNAAAHAYSESNRHAVISPAIQAFETSRRAI